MANQDTRRNWSQATAFRYGVSELQTAFTIRIKDSAAKEVFMELDVSIWGCQMGGKGEVGKQSRCSHTYLFV